MYAEVVAIGDEVLRGSIVNSNAAFISRALLGIGWSVNRHTALSDHSEELKINLQEALERSSIVIATGGLGPTFDDVTRQAAAALFSSDFHYDEEVASDLSRRFGPNLTSLKDQATLPVKAKVLLNRVGTAPGLVFHQDKQTLILMPGVPLEMQAMCEEQVIPFLLETFPNQGKFYQEVVSICLLPESSIDPLLRELKATDPHVQIGIYPSHGLLSVSFTADKQERIAPLKERLVAQFKTYVYPSVSGKIEEAVHAECKKRKKTLAFAESCTGGMIAEKITTLPGASDFFLGSLVAYSNQLKTSLLSVSEDTLKKYGAVSKETVKEMLEGLFKVTHADFGIAVSGIAGPAGGSPEKPIGTIWAAIGEKGRDPDIFTFRAKGNRQAIILYTTQYLLAALWRKMAGFN